MSSGPYREYELRVTITKFSDGCAKATVWARLRNGTLAPLSVHSWPAGAPTPHQFILLDTEVSDELQALILGTCGVQGVLLEEGYADPT